MEHLEALKLEIKKALDSGAEPLAAFDADGTLWDFDIGEEFFAFQIEQKHIPDLRPDAWEHYFSMFKTHSPQEAYLWLAQINKGQSQEQMLQWSRECANMLNVPYFSQQEELIRFLKDLKVEVVVVTASIRYAVAGAAEHFGIDFDHVLGVDVELVDGMLTDRQKGPITWREGKKIALQEKFPGRKPLLCAGNTMGDLQLLEHASPLRLVMSKASKEHKNFKTEQELLNIAKDRGWFFSE